nr:hypothetical protein [Micromonospora sp. DSM 115978]
MTIAEVSLTEGRSEDLYALFNWLQREDELRGRISTSSRRPGPDEMGSVVEILSIALGSGGAGAVLAGSLTTWLQTRRARISVELLVSEGGETIRKLEVDAGSAAAAKKLYGLLTPDQELP